MDIIWTGSNSSNLLIFLVLCHNKKQFAFLDRAIAIYNYIQQESKTFRLIYLIKSLKETIMKEQFYSYIQNLQDQIVAGLEAVDGQAKFREDLWDRSEGGGEERVIENGAVFEKGGVNILLFMEIAGQHAKAI
jgi:hypothetical protein